MGAPLYTSTNLKVYSIKINDNGALGAWVETTSLPENTLYQYGFAVSNGYLYVIGGYTSSGIATRKVYTAKINSDGSIGNWFINTSLPESMANHKAIGINDHLVVIKG